MTRKEHPTSNDYGGPAEWDYWPPAWLGEFRHALAEYGHTVRDCDDDWIEIDVPGLTVPTDDEGAVAWCLNLPGYNGWSYGVYRDGYCPNPTFFEPHDSDGSDPREMAGIAAGLVAEHT